MLVHNCTVSQQTSYNGGACFSRFWVPPELSKKLTGSPHGANYLGIPTSIAVYVSCPLSGADIIVLMPLRMLAGLLDFGTAAGSATQIYESLCCSCAAFHL